MSEKKCGRKTGRFPWGKGLVFENAIEFYEKVHEMHLEGMPNFMIVIRLNNILPKECQMTSMKTFTGIMGHARLVKDMQVADQIQEMRDAGLTWTEIGKKLGVTESVARLRLSKCRGREGDYSNFLSKVEMYKAKGMNEKEIVDQLNEILPSEYQLSLSEFRAARSVALSEAATQH